jgi:hypothetical protein
MLVSNLPSQMMENKLQTIFMTENLLSALEVHTLSSILRP